VHRSDGLFTPSLARKQVQKHASDIHASTNTRTCTRINPPYTQVLTHAPLLSGLLLQVVAPVRETAAQALGVVLRNLPAACLPQILNSLSKLVKHSWWEVRHGGMLGLKYMIAVR
jgi:hypothetical protein